MYKLFMCLDMCMYASSGHIMPAFMAHVLFSHFTCAGPEPAIVCRLAGGLGGSGCVAPAARRRQASLDALV